MPHLLYELPHPSEEGQITLEEHAGRLSAIVCEWEAIAPEVLAILFEDVHAVRCTYEEACTLDSISQAHDRIIDIGDTAWLREVRAEVEDGSSLKHLLLCVEDGPCYEFICSGFRTEQGVVLDES